MKKLLLAFMPLLTAQALGATSVVSGRLTLAESGRVVLDGKTEAKPDAKTRYWQNRKPVTALLPIGTAVVARIAADGTLRELADAPTYAWLAAIRQEPQEATFVAEETGRVQFNLTSGGEFSYRRTETSRLEPAAPAPGARLWVTGRLMANGDTRLVLATDRRPAAPTVPGGPKAERLAKIRPSGAYEAELVVPNPTNQSMMVRVHGKLYAIAYTGATRFTMDGKRVGPASLEAGMDLLITSRTDRFGRMLASKVEIL